MAKAALWEHVQRYHNNKVKPKIKEILTALDSKANTSDLDNVLVSGSQTTTSSADGGSNVYTFTDKSGKTSTFTVKNGNRGTAAGFGTPTASVDANTGTPSVTVTSSGSNTAKVFNFVFKNLKGAKGDKGDKGDPGSDATVTVDSALSETSTNPVQNKVIHSAFAKKQDTIWKNTDPYVWSLMSNGEELEDIDVANVCVEDDIVLYNSDFTELGFNNLHEIAKNVKSRPRTATIVVAASDSKNKDTADYVCTGTNDHTVINNAIDALPSTGGKVVLLEGTYNCSGVITISKNNVTFEGMGAGTVVNTTYNFWTGAIAASGSNVQFRNFTFNGSTMASNYNGIRITGTRAVVDGVRFNNFDKGIYVQNSDKPCYSSFTRNIFENCIVGIEVNHATRATVSSNYYLNCTTGALFSDQIHDSIISNNIVYGGTTGINIATSCTLNSVVGNVVREASSYGIYCMAQYTIINSNFLYNNGEGIYSSGGYHTITGNLCRDNTTGINVAGGTNTCVTCNTIIRSSYSDVQYSILLSSSTWYCLVTGNCIGGKACVDNGSGHGNIIENNRA